MKVVMTGATGLIGQAIGLELARRGHKLVVVSRQSADIVKSQVPFPCEVIQWDGSGHISSPALAGTEGLIHLVGESVAEGRWTDAKKARIRSSRVDYTQKLASEFQRQGVRLKTVVSASAIGIYGDRNDETLDESSSAGDDFLSEICLSWEAAARELPSDALNIIRIGIVLSSQGGALDKMLPAFRWGAGGVLGSGRQWMSWIHLDDLVQIFVQRLESAQSGIFNAVAPGAVTNREFTSTLAEVIGVPAIVPVPRLALQLAFGELAQVLLGSQRVISNSLNEIKFKFQYPTLELALKESCLAATQGVNEFNAKQWLDVPVAQVFEFFSSERNLERITPPFLNFVVQSVSTPQVREGTTIDYTLSLHGLPLRWRTLIEVWEPGKRFVDVQIKGPYSLWHHTHEFEALGRGTLMTDRVLYKVPMGVLGKAVAGIKVKRDISQIFEYRRKTVAAIFPYK